VTANGHWGGARGERAGIDTDTPNIARMYDYYLGGKDNFAVDREAAEKVLALFPQLPTVARENRAFLGRAVRFLAGEAGVRQFVDVGAGLPTMDNVHRVARREAPDARVLYVDYDPVVAAHGRALLADSPTVGVIQADLRNPKEILDHPERRSVIDLAEPVAVLLVAILHFVPDDDDPRGIVARLRDALAPGSYLVVSHAGGADVPAVREAAAEYQRATAPMVLRSRPEVLRFFDGFDLVDPGLVDIGGWRNPARDAQDTGELAQVGWVGVARKP